MQPAANDPLMALPGMEALPPLMVTPAPPAAATAVSPQDDPFADIAAVISAPGHSHPALSLDPFGSFSHTEQQHGQRHHQQQQQQSDLGDPFASFSQPQPTKTIAAASSSAAQASSLPDLLGSPPADDPHATGPFTSSSSSSSTSTAAGHIAALPGSGRSGGMHGKHATAAAVAGTSAHAVEAGGSSPSAAEGSVIASRAGHCQQRVAAVQEHIARQKEIHKFVELRALLEGVSNSNNDAKDAILGTMAAYQAIAAASVQQAAPMADNAAKELAAAKQQLSAMSAQLLHYQDLADARDDEIKALKSSQQALQQKLISRDGEIAQLRLATGRRHSDSGEPLMRQRSPLPPSSPLLGSERHWLEEAQGQLMETQSLLSEREAEVRALKKERDALKAAAAATAKATAAENAGVADDSAASGAGASGADVAVAAGEAAGSAPETADAAAVAAAEAAVAAAAAERSALRERLSAAEAESAALRVQLAKASAESGTGRTRLETLQSQLDDAWAAAAEQTAAAEAAEARANAASVAASKERSSAATATEAAKQLLKEREAQLAAAKAELQQQRQQRHGDQPSEGQEDEAAAISAADGGEAAESMGALPPHALRELRSRLAALGSEKEALHAELAETQGKLASLLSLVRNSANQQQQQAANGKSPANGSGNAVSDDAAGTRALLSAVAAVDARYCSSSRSDARELLLRGKEVTALLEGALAVVHDLKAEAEGRDGGTSSSCACPTDADYSRLPEELATAAAAVVAAAAHAGGFASAMNGDGSAAAANGGGDLDWRAGSGGLGYPESSYDAAGGQLPVPRRSSSASGADDDPLAGLGGDAWWAKPSTLEPIGELPDFLLPQAQQ